jgi:hydrogenase maturation protease
MADESRGKPSRPLVIGFGNRWRGDDAVGPLVAERLGRAGYDTIEIEADGTLLIEAWAGREWAVVVDAMASGAPPGTVRRFDGAEALAESLPRGSFRSSTHLIGLADAVELARALGRLPGRLTVFGVEGAGYDYGAALSERLAEAAPRLAEDIAALLAGEAGGPG